MLFHENKHDLHAVANNYDNISWFHLVVYHYKSIPLFLKPVPFFFFQQILDNEHAKKMAENQKSSEERTAKKRAKRYIKIKYCKTPNIHARPR